MVRIPSLSYASDAEVSSLTRTGFIISPDWSLSDEVNLGGTGGALLDDPEGWAIGAKLGYDQQIGNIVVGVITDGFYSFADGGGRGGARRIQVRAQLLRHRARPARLLVRPPHGLRHGWLRLRRARSEEHRHRRVGRARC